LGDRNWGLAWISDKAIKEIPREREVIELFKKLIGAGPLRSR